MVGSQERLICRGARKKAGKTRKGATMQQFIQTSTGGAMPINPADKGRVFFEYRDPWGRESNIEAATAEEASSRAYEDFIDLMAGECQHADEEIEIIGKVYFEDGSDQVFSRRKENLSWDAGDIGGHWGV